MTKRCEGGGQHCPFAVQGCSLSQVFRQGIKTDGLSPPVHEVKLIIIFLSFFSDCSITEGDNGTKAAEERGKVFVRKFL